MEPGSLVVFDLRTPKMLGVVLSEFIEHTGMLNDRPHLYRWWKVLCNNEIIIEFEKYLKLVG